MHKSVGNLTIIGSDNGLSPCQRQAIIWTNAGILLMRPLKANFSGILIEIHTFPFKKMQLNRSSLKWRPFCLRLNVLSHLQTQWCPSSHPTHNFRWQQICGNLVFSELHINSSYITMKNTNVLKFRLIVQLSQTCFSGQWFNNKEMDTLVKGQRINRHKLWEPGLF